MAFLGLVPDAHTSENKKQQSSITLMGNSHARRMLVEYAWSYRFPAKQTMHLKRKAVNASEEVKAIAWKSQKWLCGRYRTLTPAAPRKLRATSGLINRLSDTLIQGIAGRCGESLTKVYRHQPTE